MGITWVIFKRFLGSFSKRIHRGFDKIIQEKITDGICWRFSIYTSRKIYGGVSEESLGGISKATHGRFYKVTPWSISEGTPGWIFFQRIPGLSPSQEVPERFS